MTASYISYLVLPCTMLIFAIGYYLGRSRVKHEREKVLKALSNMLQSTDQLSQDVDTHNNELAGMGESVRDLNVSSDMAKVQNMLLGHIKGVISSNKRLEDDLTCARYTLEQQAQELDKTRHEVRTDELSGVANRRAFDETMSYRLSKWKRQGEAFALVVCDIDHFKWINDTHGHQAGDTVVKGVGSLMMQCLRENDFVARYGGDEFAILLHNECRESTIKLAEKIRSSAETQNFSAAGKGERVAITFSMGLAFVQEGDTAADLFQRADALLYQAKDAGRNCLRIESARAQEEENLEMPAMT